jgi:hypothetical protein
MRKIAFVYTLFVALSVSVYAQEKQATYIDMAVIYHGDTIAVVNLKPVYIFAPMKFKNEKQRQEYSKLVRDIRVAYPYAKIITTAVLETYEYMQSMPTDKERNKYMNDVQKYIMAEYKPKMRKMTKNQGKILIKLVDRQCNTSSYNIVKALVGSFKAGVYNTFASLFGNSLKAEYDPEGKDAAIEAIVVQLEQGTLDYYYSVNYHEYK